MSGTRDFEFRVEDGGCVRFWKFIWYKCFSFMEDISNLMRLQQTKRLG